MLLYEDEDSDLLGQSRLRRHRAAAGGGEHKRVKPLGGWRLEGRCPMADGDHVRLVWRPVGGDRRAPLRQVASSVASAHRRSVGLFGLDEFDCAEPFEWPVDEEDLERKVGLDVGL
jgi:hypothetical protein